MPRASYSFSSGPLLMILYPSPAVCVSSSRIVIGFVAGRLSSEVSGLVSTRIVANAGKYLDNGSSSPILPSSIRIIAAIAVTGLVIE